MPLCLVATLCQLEPKSSYNLDVNIELKGLSREQVTNLLPEGLISLCWRGSVAHGCTCQNPIRTQSTTKT